VVGAAEVVGVVVVADPAVDAAVPVEDWPDTVVGVAVVAVVAVPEVDGVEVCLATDDE
jgi:hypothetical protein